MRKNKKVNWDSIDWTMPDRDIADSHKLLYHRVHQKRIELHKPAPTKEKNAVLEIWGDINWEMSNAEISMITGRTHNNVDYWRNRMSKPLIKEYRTYDKSMNYNHKIKNFNKIDWSLQDVIISEKHNVSRERIRQLRKIFNKPKSVNHGKKKGNE